MNTIIVHTPQNEESRRFRYYNYFWELLIDFLKTKFIVEEDVYYIDANKRSYVIKLLNDTECEILECEMIIENKTTKEYVVMSVADLLTGAVLNHQCEPLCKKVIFAQYDEGNLKDHMWCEGALSKYSPWIYFPSNIFDIDSIYHERLEKKELINKFYFRGTSMEDRTILNHFNREYFEGGLPNGVFDDYARDLINYKVALSIAGRGEFCYRDVENFGLGVPIMRFEYVNKMFKPLIPNYHYISVERPSDLIYDRTGNPEHAKMLEERFLEVKDDIDFLNFISKNARQYYDDYLSKEGSVKLTYEILNLNEWE